MSRSTLDWSSEMSWWPGEESQPQGGEHKQCCLLEESAQEGTRNNHAGIWMGLPSPHLRVSNPCRAPHNWGCVCMAEGARTTCLFIWCTLEMHDCLKYKDTFIIFPTCWPAALLFPTWLVMRLTSSEYGSAWLYSPYQSQLHGVSVSVHVPTSVCHLRIWFQANILF